MKYFAVTLIVAFGTIQLVSAQTNVVPDDVEFQALKAIYDSLGGPNWKNNNKWPAPGSWPTTATSAQMSKWYGVTVKNGDVTELSFHPANNLTGTLPFAIGNLTALTKLDFSNNNISGRIPVTIGQLTKLTSLKLGTNQLTGPIPAGIGNLKSLTLLDLQSNQLSGSLPDFWSNLTSLTALTIQFNQFNGSLSPSITSLVNLTQLYINNNLLSGELPANLGNLAAIQYFSVNNNNFSGPIPTSLAACAQMYLFYVNNNDFSGSLPDTFFTSWTKLGLMNLSTNNIAGPFPSSIGNCSALTYLVANNNAFTSIPSTTLTLPLVTTINFDYNELKTIPNFSTQVNKKDLQLQVGYNRLDFSLLEPLVGVGIKTITSMAQKTINDNPSQTLTLGSSLSLTSRPKGTYTSNIKWEKLQADGVTWVDISAANANPLIGITYQIGSVTADAEGSYRWSCTSTTVTGFTLFSDPIVVKTQQRVTMDALGFQYKYDGRKRMIGKKVPGADWVYMVYDSRDRLVMTQDGNQRPNFQWTVTKYDNLNRPIMTGIYTHSRPATQTAMDSLISTTNYFDSYNGSTTNHGYTNNVFPTSSVDVQTVTYYDQYTFKALINDTQYNYQFNDFPDQYNYNASGSSFPNVTGHPTGNWTKIIGKTTGLWSVNYYDDKFRTVQTIFTNALSGVTRNTTVFDFPGKVLKTMTTQKIGSALNTITHTFSYDHMGRLLQTFHSVNGTTPVLLASNDYNEIGQLVDKKLHSENSGHTYKQSVDYRYNIRGWLTRINDSNVASPTNQAENGTNVMGDLFGMNLNYNTPVAGLTNSGGVQYNGNISSITYSSNLGLGGITQRGYGFNYDPMNRLTAATHDEMTSLLWNPSSSYHEDNLTYDLNGNIKTLNRKGANGSTMDVLTYTYGTGTNGSNQLVSVSDAGDITKGFMDGNISGNDYSYDANGNMITDKNKSISSIAYNFLNLPQQVNKSTGENMKYTYDASGRKLIQQVYNSSNSLQKTTKYDGEFIYQNDTLKFINDEEGRVVMNVPPSGQASTAPEYQYHLKDHLGNVRATFSSKRTVETSIATLEPASMNLEQSQFLRYNEARKVNSTLFDHTHNGVTSYSERLSGSANEKTGLARSISVMPGDTINLTVYAKYVDASNTNNTAALNQLLAQIVAGTASAGTVIDGSSYSTNGITPFPYTGFAGEGNSTTAGPKAYLNYVMFDRNFVPILTDLTQTNFVKMSTAGKEDGTYLPNGNPHEKLYAQIISKQAGYMYVWLSNEETTPVEVYFDDLTIQQIKSPIVQQEDFYPFGLSFNKYMRENSVPNNLKLFQDQEHIDDLGLNWDSFKWRNHQPDIGRFFNVDPLADKYVYNSPYAFSENRVINGREFEGLEWVNSTGAVIYNTDPDKGKVGYTKYATQKDMRLGNSLQGSKTARGQFNKLVNSKAPITIDLNEAPGVTYKDEESKQQGKPQAGKTDPTVSRTIGENGKLSEPELEKSEITINLGSIKALMENGGTFSGEDLKGLTIEQVIGAVLGHEIHHTTIEDVKSKTSEKDAHAVSKKIIKEMKKENDDKKN